MDENEPPTKRETCVSQVRVYFDQDTQSMNFMQKLFLPRLSYQHALDNKTCPWPFSNSGYTCNLFTENWHTFLILLAVAISFYLSHHWRVLIELYGILQHKTLIK